MSEHARIAAVIEKLEIVLVELDGLGAWREATGVCLALERLAARQQEAEPRHL